MSKGVQVGILDQKTPIFSPMWENQTTFRPKSRHSVTTGQFRDDQNFPQVATRKPLHQMPRTKVLVDAKSYALNGYQTIL